MRVGSITPRINGIPMSPIRLGRLGFSPGTAQAQIDSYTNSFIYGLPSDVEHGTAATPDVVAASLISAARETCTDANQCPDMSAQIAAAVDKYTAAYNAAQANTQAQVEQGQIAVPQDYFAANPNVYSPYQNPGGLSPAPAQPNALNTVAPQQVNVQPVPKSNVLTPPTTSAPVSNLNTGSFTGTSTVAVAPGSTGGGMTEAFRSSVSVGGLELPVWALLGAAALGVFMMVQGKGK